MENFTELLVLTWSKPDDVLIISKNSSKSWTKLNNLRWNKKTPAEYERHEKLGNTRDRKSAELLKANGQYIFIKYGARNLEHKKDLVS